MTYFDIFRECFPVLSLTEENFWELSEIEKSKVFTRCENGKIIGFAQVCGNALRLICVLPGYRGKGVGTALFKEAESFIRENGGDMVIGGVSSDIFIGATEESVPFFERMGCKFGGLIAEMGINTAQLLEAPHTPPENVTFGFYSGDRGSLLKAVAEVEDDWVQYFNGGSIFCAESDGGIASFCFADEDVTCILSDGISKVGSIGCVGTVPRFRKKGIGLKMVSLAAQHLKSRGCGKIFIHYTGVYDWYAKLGFKTVLWERLSAEDR